MSFIHDLRRSYLSFRENSGGISFSGPCLKGEEGQRLGYIEHISYTPSSIVVEGWADADRVSLTTDANVEIAGTLPRIPRRDVQTALSSIRTTYGFSIRIPKQSGPVRLTISRGKTQVAVKLPHLSPLKRFRGELELSWRFGKLVCVALPDIVAWVRHQDKHARRRVGAMFRSPGATMLSLDISALSGKHWPEALDASITIILPVYQGLHLLNQVIGRVRDHTDLQWHLVVIDDASPDPAVLNCLRGWQEKLTKERMTLITNPTNLGFVGTSNVGLGVALTRGRHVVLLNSDALVPAGWASRLLAPLINEPNVASVTPFSNDAEIANVPFPGRPITLMPGEGDALDLRAREYAHAGSIAEVPTGVGFCMAMNIQTIRQIPKFDTTFGKGYGEEVDWCQKAMAFGWRNLLTAGLFVEHHGSQSFGPDVKQALTQKNGLVISRRYPKFDEQVQMFISGDPLRSQRMMLGIDMAARRAMSMGQRLAVFLGHGMGGGAETYLRQRVQHEIASTGHAVVIRTMPDASWHVELHAEQGKLSGKVDKIAAAMPFFSSLSGLHIVYSCGVGSVRPRDIPRALSFLSSRPSSTLEVVFNDFFPISPSYTLLDSRDAFNGFPLDPTDPAHRFVEADGSVVELAEWNAVWGEMIKKASQLTTFSPSSAAIVGAAWPEYRDRVCMQPHRLPTDIPMLETCTDEPVIGVLGNISRAKGAEVLARLSKEMAARRAGRLILIGNIEPGYVLAKPSIVLGSYNLDELAKIVAQHRINRWFLPSIWPETFSYAVHEMIATGLPVWSFDIGGQADAVKAAHERGQGGGLIPLHEGKFKSSKLIQTLIGAANERNEDTSHAN